MKTRTISLALGMAALGLAAGCSSASHTATAAAATAVATPSVAIDPYGETCPTLDSSGYCPGDDPATDPNGQTCQNTEVNGNGGYCPGDSPSPTETTDPAGDTCTSLDSQGYCPGDDPQQTDPLGNSCPSLDKQGYCPGDDPQPDKVTFIVSGSYANVTYGPAGSDYTGSVPMDVTQTIPDQPPIYYAIDAQLQGGGTVSCKIEVDGQTISQATAQGGYNIATCEISQDPLSGGWTNTNSS
jgi:hypothetical protein